MEVVFSNGTPEQKKLWLETFDMLMNLPREAIPCTIQASFVDPGELVNGGHTDLAVTTWSYGATDSTTQIRNDAPDFGAQEETLRADAAALGLPYNPTPFYHETAAHELGHSLFAALPKAARVALAQMFGADDASTDQLFPAGAAWRDKPGEGIAETFKEAFLPRRFRVFGNRTRKTISYDKFAEFRARWRNAVPEAGGESAFGPIDLFNNVFGENLEIGWPRGWKPNGMNLDPSTGKNFTKGIFRSHFGGKYALNNPFFFPPRFKYTATQPHVIAYSFTVPAEWFPFDRTWVGDTLGGLQEYGVMFLWRYFASVNGVAVADYAGAWDVGVPRATKSSVARELLLAEENASEDWPATDFWGPSGDEPASGIPWGSDTMYLWRDAVAPPVTISHSFNCDAGDELLIYGRAMGIQYWGNSLISEENIGPGGLFNPPLSAIDLAAPELPKLVFAEGGAGLSIDLPAAELMPAFGGSGTKPHARPVAGAYG